MFTGGVATVAVLVGTRPAPTDTAGWLAEAELIRLIYTRVAVPGLIGALVFGTVLAASMWQVIIRMRWFVVKFVVVLSSVPSLHMFMRSRSIALHQLLAHPAPDLQQAAGLRGQLLAGTLLTLGFAVTAIILGRIKPRLGQDYGRTFSRSAPPTPRG